MTDEKKISKLAGLLYLIVVVTGIFSLAYVPSLSLPRFGGRVSDRTYAASDNNCASYAAGLR